MSEIARAVNRLCGVNTYLVQFSTDLVILSEIDSRNGPIKLAYYVTLCSKNIYVYVWRYVCRISSACHAYLIWAKLGHCHFLYVPAVLNVVTN